jgi:hypothetical protein
MMRRVSAAELSREPARALASARAVSAEALAAELLAEVARERFTPAECRELERRYWRALAARRGKP